MGIAMLQLYENTGKMALGSRLKQLSERLAEQAARVYELYEVDLDPKWFSGILHAEIGKVLAYYGYR